MGQADWQTGKAHNAAYQTTTKQIYKTRNRVRHEANLSKFGHIVCSLDEGNVVLVEAERATHEAVETEYVTQRLQQAWHLPVNTHGKWTHTLHSSTADNAKQEKCGKITFPQISNGKTAIPTSLFYSTTWNCITSFICMLIFILQMSVCQFQTYSRASRTHGITIINTN